MQWSNKSKTTGKMRLRVHQPTMKDIATRADVSVNTVSRALRNKDDISEETRSKIIRIANELGYTYNTLARDLRQRRTSTIGVIVSDNSNPFFARVIRGIQDEARDRGYQIILANTDEDYDMEVSAIGLMLEKRVDGILIVPVGTSTDNIMLLQERGIPTVLLVRNFGTLECSYVVNDDVLGAYLATQCLLKHQNRPIVFLNGHNGVSDSMKRFAGFRKAIEESGGVFDEESVIWGCIDLDDGYRAASALLDQAKPPISLFCFSDYVAIGAIKAIREHHLAVPDDVAVVGYDDIEIVSCLEVPLTTVDHARYSIGRTGTGVLIDIIEQKIEPGEKTRIVLKPRLVERESSGTTK